jgi:dethiobiotin synthetase
LGSAVVRRVVIVGTGTGIGKTHVTCALLRAAVARGIDGIGLKPVETGVDPDAEADADRRDAEDEERFGGGGASGGELRGLPVSDQRRLARAARGWRPGIFNRRSGSAPGPGETFHVKHQDLDSERSNESGPCADAQGPFQTTTNLIEGEFVDQPAQSPRPARSLAVALAADAAATRWPGTGGASKTFHVKRSLYSFRDPISPHLAAQRDGIRIDIGAIRHWVDQNTRALTLIETAGGLFSPLARSTSNLDLVRALSPARLLLVAPDRLGVIHDLTATLGLAATKRSSPDAVILSAPEFPDASTGHNAEALIALGIASPLAIFPRLPDDHPESLAAADRVLSWLAMV